MSTDIDADPKTVAKWRSAALPSLPRGPRSTVLFVADEAIITAFHRHTLLLDDSSIPSDDDLVPRPAAAQSIRNKSRTAASI